MAFTAIPGTADAQPGNTVPGLGADPYVPPASGAMSLASATEFGVLVEAAVGTIRVSKVWVDMLVSDTAVSVANSSYERAWRGVGVGIGRGVR